MAWDSKSGDIENMVILEDEIWASFNYFFSAECRKTSTYKFGFLKAILDNLFSGENTVRGVELTFQQLFSKFAENYWNLIVKYHLRQMRYNGSSKVTGLERIFLDAVTRNGIVQYVEYSSLTADEQNRLVKKVQATCKKYVVGAMYGDFKESFYGFSLKEERIWLNPVYHSFLLKYKLNVEKLNYLEWAKLLDVINADNPTAGIIDKLELATPKRNNLSWYRHILETEFEVQRCFYCGAVLHSQSHVDHVIPWQMVREDKLWNFVLACPRCNMKKSNRVPQRPVMQLVVQRNEIIQASDYCTGAVAEDFRNYTGELLMELWQYARMGGIREWH